MPSELDRRFDDMLQSVIGPGGRLIIGEDELGRAIVANFPATLPSLFRTFCALNGDSEAIVAGEERLSFADLDRWSEQLATALVARGIAKGERVAIAMRNCPAWVVSYMAITKAGAVATLLNGWWQPHEMQHALDLVEPTLIIADGSRAKRIEGICGACPLVTLPIEQHLGQSLAPLLDGAGEAILPEVTPDDEATILFTSGSTGESKGALSTHRAVTTGVYAYATGLIVLLGLLTQENRAPATKRTLINVPLFHVTGEVPVMLNSFVINRCMVMMPKWDAGEALRLIEKEGITYFVGVPTMSLELLNHPDRQKYDLSSLTDIAAGGAPRPASHVERLQTEFPKAQPALGYGLTETNAVGCSNFWGNYAAKPDSTGRAQKPFVELAILGQNDVHLPTGQRGEIGIRSAANIRKRPTRCSRRTAMFAPATSATSTRTAICSSSTGRRTSSFAEARISPAPRLKPRSTPVLQSPRFLSSDCRTSVWAKCRSRSSFSTKKVRSRRKSCALSLNRASRLSRCRRNSSSRTSPCPSSARARSTAWR
jgi:long-chain acyl-CoA synthetase